MRRVYTITARDAGSKNPDESMSVEISSENQLQQAQADVAEFMGDDFARAVEDE